VPQTPPALDPLNRGPSHRYRENLHLAFLDPLYNCNSSHPENPENIAIASLGSHSIHKLVLRLKNNATLSIRPIPINHQSKFGVDQCLFPTHMQ
jgi:hypothetical protein